MEDSCTRNWTIYLRICVNNKRIAWSKVHYVVLDLKTLVELPLSSPCRVVFCDPCISFTMTKALQAFGQLFPRGKIAVDPKHKSCENEVIYRLCSFSSSCPGNFLGDLNPRLQGLRQLRGKGRFVLVFIKSTWPEKRCSWSKVLKVSKILKLQLWTLTKDFAICGQ